MQTVLVICGTDEDRYNLSRSQFRDYRFVYEGIDVWKPNEFNAVAFLDELQARIAGMEFDGVLGTDEMPACLLASIIAKGCGLPGPSPVSILSCQNKYVCRQMLAQSVPEAVPSFQLIDPNKPAGPNFPIFIKPVKSELSMLAGVVQNEEQFRNVVRVAQQRLPKFSRSFNQLMRRVGFSGPEGHYLLGEEILHGRQLSLDGYVYQGEVHVLAIFDSLMWPGTLSFKRFEYPIELSSTARNKLKTITGKAIKALKLDNTCFNIEYFYDEATEKVGIIEVNPRMASQFADLIEKVDGVNTYEVQLQLALGKNPNVKKRKTQYTMAASIPFRVFEDKLVTKVPTLEEIQKLQQKFPDVFVQVLAKKGERLSDYTQDSQSYRYCIVNIPAKDPNDLERIYDECKRQLSFEFADV